MIPRTLSDHLQKSICPTQSDVGTKICKCLAERSSKQSPDVVVALVASCSVVLDVVGEGIQLFIFLSLGQGI